MITPQNVRAVLSKAAFDRSIYRGDRRRGGHGWVTSGYRVLVSYRSGFSATVAFKLGEAGHGHTADLAASIEADMLERYRRTLEAGGIAVAPFLSSQNELLIYAEGKPK